MTVRKILQGKGAGVLSIAPAMPISDVTKTLADNKIGAVLVMDGDHLAGILSERDIVRVLARSGAGALTLPASSVMTQSVQTCAPDDLADDVMERMTASRFRHMPVVEHGKVVGVVSIGDVVKKRIDEAVAETEHLKSYIHS